MTYPLVVVANRLPVDLTAAADGTPSWSRSPGGLVSALEPVMRSTDGAWVGWSGSPGDAPEPFDADGMHLVPIALSEQEIADYYEGFSNDTLWPLSHDVISTPEYHRHWWDAYRRVNARFAAGAATQADEGGTVWVHDYQLQLVPAMLRELRPDLRIGYFHHIPFPPLELFAQLPWRRQVVEGLLGADVIGFQRGGDAANFIRVVRRWTDVSTRGQSLTIPAGSDGTAERHVRAAAFPISIDSARFDALARTPEIRERAAQIRRDLGSPDVLLLGVDRLDYSKGIRHRIKAFGELLADGRLEVPGAALVQVASPSRENVSAYQQLRDDVEILVARINGEHGQIGSPAIHYLHHSAPPEEMAALYLAADIMLVTSLRDGMNLVAKEFIATCVDDRGALVLSEFTGAADELSGALLVNPHDIDGLKDVIAQAVTMSQREMRTRMRRLRRRVLTDDVNRWSSSFLAALADPLDRPVRDARLSAALDAELQRLADGVQAGGTALIALDFDGVLAPLVDDPAASRTTPDSVRALDRLGRVPGVRLALVSGRGLMDLASRAEVPDGTILVGSHGAERGMWSGGLAREDHALDGEAASLHAELSAALDEAVAGTSARVEHKPTTVVLHTRQASTADTKRLVAQALRLGDREGVDTMRGKDVVELSVSEATKGRALADLRSQVGAGFVLYAGDDVTDERAFTTLGEDDVTIRVGPGATAARFRVKDPARISTLLARLADLVDGG